MRENGWDALITKVISFCCKYDIVVPDMSAPYKKGIRSCEQNITNEHYYQVNILNVVIDFQLAELDCRFPDDSLELLIVSATLDPRVNFSSFKCEDVCNLASRFYPEDFTSYELQALDMECEYCIADIRMDPRFANLTSVHDLCWQLVESRKAAFFPMIYRLICLLLTLSISTTTTTTTERTFSFMNFIKNRLRNKMEDEFLDDLMVMNIEKDLADNIDNDYVIAEFELSGTHKYALIKLEERKMSKCRFKRYE
ncbi:uncharacterized protein LOC126803561 [Argentina anserina]|uniref:uncharacterized protein LOC126803561 n=1 Tax=Argentina anserina TaxID=57926 RepID=UPI0021763E06|nr:uncharacterized protein LOC126803561 [Potentilla anserina]